MGRRHDLDWLRALLFGLLVLHHAAVGFAPFGARVYGFANDALGGPLLSLAIYWSHSWRLPALFLVAGAGLWFATAKGGGLGFLVRRLARLLAPLAVGALLLNPATGLAVAALTGAPADFLGRPPGWWLPLPPGLAMHLWFLGNLALYTALCLPLCARRDRIAAVPAAAPAALAAVVLATTAIAVAAKPWGQAIAGDGYQLPWYLGFFLGGFFVGAWSEPVLGWARRRAWALAAVALALFSAEVALIEATRPRSDALAEALAAGGWATQGLAPPWGALGAGFAVVEGLGAWAWCFAAAGFAARWLRRDGPWLRALRPAVFPIYVLHLPVTLIGLALLSRVAWPWPLELLLLAAATFALSAAGYLRARRAGVAWWIGGPAAAREKGAVAP